MLKLGSKGSAVVALQKELAAAGDSPGPIDGVFGSHTLAAVKTYQKQHHLTVDGLVGPKTLHALATDGFTPGKPKPPPAKPPAGGGAPWKPGPGHLAGADTSHYQSDATFEKSIRGAKFTAIKATEGTGYTDPTFRKRWNELGTKIKQGSMKLRIAYHFLTPGNGTAQAKHFLSSLGIKGKLPAGTRLALDWEASALKDPKALKDAANYIHQVTGLWPLVYTSASQVSRAKAAVPNAPLWEAKWSGSVPSNVPFVQTSDGPGYDHDVFNGSLAALEKFAGF